MRLARLVGAALPAVVLVVLALQAGPSAAPTSADGQRIPSRSHGDDASSRPAPPLTPEPPAVPGAAPKHCAGSDATDSYGPDQWQRYDVWKPATQQYRSKAGTYPTVVIFQGGGWILGGRCTGMPYYAQLLAAQGYLAISVDYRKLDTRDDRGHRVSVVDTSDDAVAALTTIKSRASALHLDRARLATVGTSAGGHLAHLAANRAGGVRATVSWSGFPAVQGLVERWNSTTTEGRSFPRRPTMADSMAARARPPLGASAVRRYERIDPVRSIQTSPPHQLLLACAWDRFILPGMPFEYARVARAAGKDAQVIIFSDPQRRGLHASAMWANTKAWDKGPVVDAYVQRWLRGALGLAGPVAAPRLRFATGVSRLAHTGVSVTLTDFRISALPEIYEGVYGATAWVQSLRAGTWVRVSPVRYVQMRRDGLPSVSWTGLKVSPGEKLRAVVTTPKPVAGAPVAVPTATSR